MSSKYRLLFVFVLLSLIGTLSSTKEHSERSFSRINGNRDRQNGTTLKESSMKKSSAFALSAVGIIMFILTVVLSGIFIYYFFLFYPILCRKERNYDVVEHSRDTTPTPNIENTQ